MPCSVFEVFFLDAKVYSCYLKKSFIFSLISWHAQLPLFTFVIMSSTFLLVAQSYVLYLGVTVTNWHSL